jgi:dihydrodipicolinate synthase/N-acetylneuraminate lyase
VRRFRVESIDGATCERNFRSFYRVVMMVGLLLALAGSNANGKQRPPMRDASKEQEARETLMNAIEKA